MNNKAFGSGTHLTRILQASLSAYFYRLVEVAIIKNHKYVIPTKFHGGFFKVLGRLCSHHATRLFGTGKRNAADTIVIDNAGNLILRDEQIGIGTFRGTSLRDHPFEGFCAVGDDASVFHHHAVTNGHIRG